MPSLIRYTVLIASLVLGALHGQALAQDADTSPRGEIELDILNTGVGNYIRAGDWFGIRVQMLDRSREQREIILRVSFTDVDGDEAQYDRVVSANPGIAQSFWVYAWLPFSGPDSGLEVRAYEARDPSGDARGQLAYRAGRLLAQETVYNPPIQSPTSGAIGVVGAAQLGLEGYGVSIDGRNWRPQAHELKRIVRGLETSSLPDRTLGLVSLDTIVWGSGTLRGHDPSTLSPERAAALTDWIRQGGHLVVVLPGADDPWYRGSHALSDVLPRVRVRRRDGADYNELRPLLTESPDAPLPQSASLHVFEPTSDGTRVILRSPKSEALAVRRQLGSGAVTVLGIDLGNGELRRLGLADPETLWHRVLGMRGETPRPDEMSDQELANARNRDVLQYDTTITSEISKTGRAVQGVLFGIVLFSIYWIVAGPAGFFLLKHRKLHHHAWAGFLALIIVFTAVSWIGASAMRPKTVDITHLSLYERVHGQPDARVRAWASVMLPSYGSSEISLDEDGSDFAAIAPWEPSVLTGAVVSGFPDNTGYRIESRDPSAVRVPTRATVKQIRADWTGRPSWDGISIQGTELGVEPRLTWEGRTPLGVLTHGFPGALTDVKIIVVNRQTPILQPGAKIGSALIAQASVWSPAFAGQEWGPGEPLDLKIATTPSAGNPGDARSFLQDSVRTGIDASVLGMSGRGGSLSTRLLTARLLSQLEPPNYSTGNRGVGSRLATRHETHGWDLGRWFTQPCVIVVGMLETEDPDAEAFPAPLLVDGRRPPARGKTMVTWICPMGSEPPTYPWLAPVIDEDGI